MNFVLQQKKTLDLYIAVARPKAPKAAAVPHDIAIFYDSKAPFGLGVFYDSYRFNAYQLSELLEAQATARDALLKVSEHGRGLGQANHRLSPFSTLPRA